MNLYTDGCVDGAKAVYRDLLDAGVIQSWQAYQSLCRLPLSERVITKIDSVLDDWYENDTAEGEWERWDELEFIDEGDCLPFAEEEITEKEGAHCNT